MTRCGGTLMQDSAAVERQQQAADEAVARKQREINAALGAVQRQQEPVVQPAAAVPRPNARSLNTFGCVVTSANHREQIEQDKTDVAAKRQKKDSAVDKFWEKHRVPARAAEAALEKHQSEAAAAAAAEAVAVAAQLEAEADLRVSRQHQVGA